jgi:FAD:protein FMN transferase
MLLTIRRWAIFVCAFLISYPIFGSENYFFFHENVLGTSLDLRIAADTERSADQAEEAVLTEIERLRKVLSSYDPKSELREWLKTENLPVALSADLTRVMLLSDQFRERTQGAFNPTVAAATELWFECEKKNRLPLKDELLKAASYHRKSAWQFDPINRFVQRHGQFPVNLDALAKGYIVDRACEFAMLQPGILGVLVNIGGDLRCQGQIDHAIAITDPFQPAENVKPLTTIALRNRAIATSGNYQRGFDIDGNHYSHIIDPRSAMPVKKIVSASVLATEAVTADALATAMNVLDVEQSMSLCGGKDCIECMLVLENGDVVYSSGWPVPSRASEKLVAAPSAGAKDDPLWKDQSKLTIDFEINRAGNDGRYRRPYVAVWVEDSDGFPVRTLTLWLQTSPPGPRWHRDLRKWYKNDTMRKLVDGKNLIDSISAATKPPGKYKVVWDGKDDHGQLVKQGKYTLLIEAAREHGTYQIMKKELDFSNKPFAEKLEGNVEIKEASLEYRLGAG